MTTQSRHRPTSATPSIPPTHAFVHLVTLTEASERTGYSTIRIKDQVRRGNIRAYRVGDLFVFRLDDLARLVDFLESLPPRRTSGRTAA
jgi:hypothetical protein